MNCAASPATLARIAALDIPALHERFGGSPELMGGNRMGLAVMRLVIRNAKVGPQTLALLAKSPNSHVVGDVAGNKATPPAVREQIHRDGKASRDSYMIAWGLAHATAAPVAKLRELAERSRNKYALRAVARNPSAPDAAKSLAGSRIAGGDFKPS